MITFVFFIQGFEEFEAAVEGENLGEFLKLK